MLQFLKYVFATIVGVFLFFVIGFFIIAGIAAAAGSEKKATVKANSVLKLNLDYTIPEKTNDNPFAGLSIGNLKPSKAVGLTDLRACIKKACERRSARQRSACRGHPHMSYQQRTTCPTPT